MSCKIYFDMFSTGLSWWHDQSRGFDRLIRVKLSFFFVRLSWSNDPEYKFDILTWVIFLSHDQSCMNCFWTCIFNRLISNQLPHHLFIYFTQKNILIRSNIYLILKKKSNLIHNIAYMNYLVIPELGQWRGGLRDHRKKLITMYW